jgi:hypothetical protein
LQSCILSDESTYMGRLSTAHRFFVSGSFDEDKAAKAQASWSGLIMMGFVSLCLLTYHQGCSDALQLSQSTSWTHIDAQSICIVQSGLQIMQFVVKLDSATTSSKLWRHFAFSMKQLTLQLSLNRYSVQISDFWIYWQWNCQSAVTLSILIADHQGSHCDCCYEYDPTLL